MRAVAVHVDALHILGVDIARDMVALINDQTLFACLFGLVGKHGTEQTGTNDEIIVLFHVLFPFCRSCFRRSLFLGEIILVDGILNAAASRLRGDML